MGCTASRVRRTAPIVSSLFSSIRGTRTAGFFVQLSMNADQQAFRATDGGAVKYDAQVSCQTHSAWMRVALAVAEEQVRGSV